MTAFSRHADAFLKHIVVILTTDIPCNDEQGDRGREVKDDDVTRQGKVLHMHFYEGRITMTL